MKRILINATHNEEIRVALCKDNYLFDFDLENRTREQKKANIYKGIVTRVEPSLEAVFVEYGSQRQGFLPLREIAPEYLHGGKDDSIKQLIKEGDELIVQIEKEERGNKGAAISTFISLAGRYLVLMPNNAKGGGISRQISGKVRDEMRSIIASLSIPKGMSIIVRTAGIGKTFEDLQNDLNHLLHIWQSIVDRHQNEPAPTLLYQEAGVVTRAMRDYLRDDISEIWIDAEHAYNEAAQFISEVMPTQMNKLRKYMDYEPLFVRFGIERQIESAYQREVRLPSGGSIVIDQTEAMVAIDINSAKSTKGSDVAETAFHTNLEAADEIARQLRLRDMGGLIVIDFIDMAEPKHQKEVEKRLIDATRYDRARVQFSEISKFGLLEMSRQRLRPSLEEATGYVCPRCHGNGMIRDVRSLALSIMRAIEQLALKNRFGEVQAEVPTEIAAFLLNEKRESLVYLEQDSGVRITVLPHAHLESPNYSLHFNPDGFAPATYDRITDVEEQLNINRGYEVNWQTKPVLNTHANHWQKQSDTDKAEDKNSGTPKEARHSQAEPKAVAWLSNLFAPKEEAHLADYGSQDIAAAIETIVNQGGVSLGVQGTLEALHISAPKAKNSPQKSEKPAKAPKKEEKIDSDKKVEKPAKAKGDKEKYPKREAGSQREPRAAIQRGTPLVNDAPADTANIPDIKAQKDKKPSAKTENKKDPQEVKDERKAKSVKSDELAIYVQKNDEVKAPSEAVHLSLDDDTIHIKPIKKANDDLIALDAKTKDDNPPEHDSDDKPNQAKTGKDAPVLVEAVSTQAKPSTHDNDASTNNIAQALESQEKNSALEAHQDQPSSQAQSPEQVKDNKNQRRSQHHLMVNTGKFAPITAPNNDALSQLAHRQNRAINDPRVVQSTFAAPKAIAGSAYDFIKRTLTNADQLLDKQGFVPTFILALDTQSQTAHGFDFANYGYNALPQETLDAFLQATQATDAFDAVAGKTTPPPLVIGERAINDPRGAYIEPKIAKTKAKSDSKKEKAPAIQEAETPANHTVSDDIVHHLSADAVDAQALVDAVDVNKVTAKAVDVTQQVDTKGSESSEDTNSLLASAEEMVNGLLDSIQEFLDLNDSKPQEKTTQASYKNMIENIAEQLLPQTGILKLATPKKAVKKTPAKKPTKVAIKIPKNNTKPKTEIRKRSKSETPSENGSDTP